MTHYETAVVEFVTQGDLAGLAKAGGPCISATLNIPDPAHLRPELNALVRDLEKRLKEARLDARTAKTLLEPLGELAATIQTDRDWSMNLALYRSPDTVHCFRVPEAVNEAVVIQDVFDILPLLPVVSREQRFYFLALSQKKVRLFDCSRYRINEIELQGRAPQNLRLFLNSNAPDHVLDNRSSAGASVGAMKGVVFGTGSDREKQDEYLAHFFNEVDKGLHKVVGSDTAPLLVSGVEYEVALYRKVNTYPHLMEREVHGSPEAMSLPQLHERALDIVKSSLCAAVEKLLREIGGHRAANRVEFNVDAVIQAASEGRVSHVLLREEMADAKMNLAALQTLRHGGEAYALREPEMPDHAAIAALIRF
jgi:hypothetical protein